MSAVQPMVAPPDRGASPLMSNNPFRNRINSQVSPQPSPAVVSTNPFLDVSEIGTAVDSNTQATRSNSMNKTTEAFVWQTHSQQKDTTCANYRQAALDVTDRSTELTKTRSRQATDGPRRPDPNSLRAFPRPPGHRSTTSDEERRRLQGKSRPELDIFADPFDLKPARMRSSKPRRNSDTSVMDKPAMDPEEEKKRKERKYRESKKVTAKSGKPNKKLDVIDKLDVTSIYGTGLFHHDGPFDACNPHRNRKREKYAPMQAFPKDSVNMIIGGSGPVNKTLDYNKFHGFGQEAHRDYNEAAVVDEPAQVYPRELTTDKHYGFNPNARDQLHGDESAGLGTSTFLEGAPASRTAMQRRESEIDIAQMDDRPGLGRKKSLAQRIRGVRPTRDRFSSPDGRNGPKSPPLTAPITGQSENGTNPFFKEFNGAPKETKDNVAITFDEQTKPARPRAPSSPMRNELERRNTTDSTTVPDEPATAKPSGLLGRMKSLKGGRRPAVRRDTNS